MIRLLARLFPFLFGTRVYWLPSHEIGLYWFRKGREEKEGSAIRAYKRMQEKKLS